MTMLDPWHPIWTLLRLVAMMATLVTILYLTASRFDETELKTIIAMFIASAGIEGSVHMIQSKKA